MEHLWYPSGGDARFRGESAALHSALVPASLRNCRKLKAFSGRRRDAVRRPMALLLQHQRARWGWTTRAPGTWCGPSRVPRQLLRPICASSASRSICPGSQPASPVLQPARRRPPSRSFPATCSPVWTSHASITSRPGPPASRTCCASAKVYRRPSTTQSSNPCAARADGGEILKPRRALRIGARVEIRNGPFAGLLAIIDRPCSAAGRVQILLDLLRRQTRLDLPVSAIVPV